LVCGLTAGGTIPLSVALAACIGASWGGVIGPLTPPWFGMMPAVALFIGGIGFADFGLTVFLRGIIS
jgi:hypothetical protein